MHTLFILNDAPYGSERSYNALRLAKALAKCDAASTLARGILRSYAASLQAYYSLFASEER